MNKIDKAGTKYDLNLNNKEEQFGEELFNLLVCVLNSPANREVLDSIRGEYGLLWYLLKADGPITVGELAEHLQVVPGRMTDILKNLEKKGMILRSRSEQDRRVVVVSLCYKKLFRNVPITIIKHSTFRK